MEALALRTAPDGVLHVVRHVPAGARGIVFLCHGLGEHCGRYGHVIDALVAAGWGCYAFDLRGHGRSGGRRGHVLAWSDYVGDVEAVYAQAEADGHRALPWIQLGHSMGGLVVVHAAARNAARLSGLVLCSPLLGVAVQVPVWKAALGRALSRWLPALSLANELDDTNISRDPEEVRLYREDPLVHDRVTARWFTEMTAALAAAHELAPSMRLPLLLMHGTADALTDPEGSRRFAAAWGGPVELHLLDGYVHELFNDTGRERPLSLLTEWLLQFRQS
jgi:alpha-beta hydrolase superfamily lysophospholipase